jgi:hypothetical protein
MTGSNWWERNKVPLETLNTRKVFVGRDEENEDYVFRFEGKEISVF